MSNAPKSPRSAKITTFQREFRWLSNFWKDESGYCVEMDYQSHRTLDASSASLLRNAPTPGYAKFLSHRVTTRPDWNEIKSGVMLECLRKKFVNPVLRAKLLATGDHILEHGNNHGDAWWGTVAGVGRNELGKLLMRVREELRK